MARRITDLPLPPLGVLQVAGNYNTPVAATLSNGDPLDPFYAAKAEPYIHGGDCFWIPGVRPVESMPATVQTALSNLAVATLPSTRGKGSEA